MAGFIEVCVYFLEWTVTVLYSIFTLYNEQTDVLKNDPQLHSSLRDLSPGWKFLSRLKDVSDMEWSTWKFFIATSWHYLILQFIISEIIRGYAINYIRQWYILSSMIYFTWYMSARHLIALFMQPAIFFVIIWLGFKKTAVWITSLILLMIYNSLKYKVYIWNILDHETLQDEEVYLLLYGVAWNKLRCISFCIDFIDKHDKLKKIKKYNVKSSQLDNLLNLFSYVLYLPLLCTGPLMLYEKFKCSFEKKDVKLTVRLYQFAVDMMLYTLYTFLLDFAFHYIYFYAMQDNMEAIKRLPVLAVCGGGLWMGIQFHLKYVISYGTTSTFASLDNMEPPPTPRCILRVHLYSQMWRYFDVGLYQFLVKYIYKPGFTTLSQYMNLSITKYKIIASLLTFLFIFMWHGVTWNIFVWSLLNYIGILLEFSGKAVSHTNAYKKFKETVLRSDTMEARFVAACCAPLLGLSAISNFYLFGGTEVGNYFFSLLKAPAWYNLAFVLVTLYCCCQVSIALQNIPSRKDTRSMTTTKK